MFWFFFTDGQNSLQLCQLNRNKAINKIASCSFSLWKMTGIIREEIVMVNSSDRWNESPAGNAYLLLLHLMQKLRSLVYFRCLNFKWLEVNIFIKSIPFKFQTFQWRRFQLAFLWQCVRVPKHKICTSVAVPLYIAFCILQLSSQVHVNRGKANTMT